jgi:urate oxidase
MGDDAAGLKSDSYGKSAIRLVKVVRDGDRHSVHDLTVDVHLEGDFLAAHTVGDNSAVLPTDTMKNTVYALARQRDVDPPEAFAAAVGARLLGSAPHASRVTVEIAKHGWNRIAVDGSPSGTAFEHGSNEVRVARVRSERGAAATSEAGLTSLFVLRTAGSAFSGFPRDEYTTLRETRDRIFATSVTARWKYGAGRVDFNAAFVAVRQALLETFATHPSESVQHTLYAMGRAALAARAEVSEIRLLLPNKHHLLVDLTPFKLDNPNEIFVATSEPYGLIEATLVRGG